MLFFIKELSWKARKERTNPTQIFFVSASFSHFAQQDIRLKWRIWFCSERNGWVASVEYRGILYISWCGPVLYLLRGGLCWLAWFMSWGLGSRGSSPASSSSPALPAGWLQAFSLWWMLLYKPLSKSVTERLPSIGHCRVWRIREVKDTTCES